MVRAVALAGMLAGCYSARPFPGAPCSATDQCPSPLVCAAGRCDVAGAVDASGDAPGDAIPADTAMRGPSGWFPATPVPGVNTSSNETDPSFTEDQLTLVFTSDRPGGTGGRDLYLGTRTTMSDPFAVRELTELNSTSNEQSPEISQNGLTIYFVSNKLNNGTLYRATRAAVTDPFGAADPVIVKNSGTTVTNGNKNLVAAGIGADGLEAVLVPVKNLANQMFGYDVESTGTFDTDFEIASLELGAAASNPSISFLGPAANATADVYLNANTPAQIYTSTYTAGVGANGTFTSPTPVPDFNDVGTRNAAPCISAGGSFIMFERDGDLVQTTK
jgi:hypothetical protein